MLRPSVRVHGLGSAQRGMLLIMVLAAAWWSVAAGPATGAQGTDGGEAVVDVLPVQGFLDPPVSSSIVGVIAEANRRGAALVVLQVDGPGAVSADAGALLQAVADSQVPVAVFVSPQQGITAQAGGLYGLLWATAPVRAMSETAAIGPLDPLDLASGTVIGAQARTRLDEIGAGPTRTSAQSAAQLEQLGAVDVVAPNVAAMLAELDGREVTLGDGVQTRLSVPAGEVRVRLHSLGILNRLLHAAAAPAFIYLLLVFGLGALAFEVFQPGFGVAGFAGLVLLPFAIFGLTVLPVTWWALGLVLGGLVLYGLDTAMAGLGAVTAAATAAFGTGSWFLFGTGTLRVPVAVAIIMTIAVLVFFVVVLTMVLRAQAGPEGIDVQALVDRHGIVRSVLNPQGHVYVDDALWRARLRGDGRLRVGTPVTVVDVDGAVLVVETFQPPPAATSTDEVTGP